MEDFVWFTRIHFPAAVGPSSHLPFLSVLVLVTVIDTITVFVEGVFEEGEDSANTGQAERHRLPSLDVLDHLCGLLTFPEVDHLTRKFIFRAIVDERQRCEVDTYQIP